MDKGTRYGVVRVSGGPGKAALGFIFTNHAGDGLSDVVLGLATRKANSELRGPGTIEEEYNS